MIHTCLNCSPNPFTVLKCVVKMGALPLLLVLCDSITFITGAMVIGLKTDLVFIFVFTCWFRVLGGRRRGEKTVFVRNVSSSH